MTTFQLFSKPLPNVIKNGLARSLSLLVWSDGRIWIEWIDNRGNWKNRHVTGEYAERLIRAADLKLITPQEI